MSTTGISPLTTALFQGADTDGNGSLSATEFKKLAPTVTGEASPSDADTIAAFNKLDTNGDGSLTVDELAQTTFSGNTLSAAAQANIQAYSSLNDALSSISSNTAAGLYASLSNVGSNSASPAGLTEKLLAGSLESKNLIA